MIEIDCLAKSFDGRTVIDDLTLSIEPGTVTALLGRNGAAKTTLLRLIAGLDHSDRGTIAVCGRAVGAEPYPTRLLGVHLGPEAMDPRLTVGRHLQWLGVLADTPKRRVAQVLAEVELSDQRNTRIATLSTGARQRLSIAGALLADPPVLIFDEPINGLDVPGIVWLRTLLRGLARAGKTILTTTHALSEVVAGADRIVVLERGKVTAAGALRDVVGPDVDPCAHLEAILIDGYTGRPQPVGHRS